MRTNYRAAVILAALAIMTAGACGEKEPVAAPRQEPVLQQSFDMSEVTFVELGSVNCIPCKMMQPVMKQVESTYKGRVKVVFHDVWTAEGRPFGEMYGIRAIPTQIFQDKNGKEFHRHTGFYPFDQIQAMLKQYGVEP